MPEALHQMVIHHADGLHEGVANRASYKPKVSPLQLFAHGIRLKRAGGNVFHRLPSVLLGMPFNKLPDELIEATEFILHGKKCFGIVDRGLNLEPVTNNPRIRHEFRLLLHPVLGNQERVELIERLSIVFSLFENCGPTQPRLCSFKDQKLEEQSVIVNRNAPLGIVVLDVLFSLCPRAACAFGSFCHLKRTFVNQDLLTSLVH